MCSTPSTPETKALISPKKSSSAKKASSKKTKKTVDAPTSPASPAVKKVSTKKLKKTQAKEDAAVEEPVKKEKKEKKEKKDAAAAPARKTKRDEMEADEGDAGVASVLPEPATKKAKNGLISIPEFLKEHEIVIKNGDIGAPFQTFDCVAKYTNPAIQRAFEKAGFTKPSCIQSVCWPPALAGSDLIAVAKTGSGKTVGFLIPAYHRILKSMPSDPRQPRLVAGAPPMALVMSPTRELCLQIYEESQKFGNSSRIVTVAVYGGMPSGQQIRGLRKGSHLVVATPGRLVDLLELDNPPVTNLNCIEYIVLDEADQMLDMGFEQQITKIMNMLPPVRQMLMFTATWPKGIRKIAERYLRNAVQVQVGGEGLKANSSITQTILNVPQGDKEYQLVQELVKAQEQDTLTLVFTNRKHLCDGLVKSIQRAGMNAVSIHGDLEQWQRIEALKKFKTGQVKTIVATDVAARGLDIDGVGLVVNYDFPPSGCEVWVHRVGRTGRAGKTGNAITFFDVWGPEKKHAHEFQEILTNSNTPVPEWLAPLAKKASNDNWYSDQKKNFFKGRNNSGGWGGGGGGGGRW